MRRRSVGGLRLDEEQDLPSRTESLADCARYLRSIAVSLQKVVKLLQEDEPEPPVIETTGRPGVDEPL